MFNDLIDAFTRWLGSFTGSLLANLIQLALYSLVIFCVWGLPWDRIISKAGFSGQTYRVLFLLVFVPVWVGPAIFMWLGPDHKITEYVTTATGIAVYGIFLYIAIAPWPIRKKTKLSSTQPSTGS
jgi:hypothetical protein